jgi:hypothetical protein
VAEIFQSEFVSFGGKAYWLMFALLVLGRTMDFLSTWIATPNMVLEGNPVAKKLGWRWGIPVNLGICVVLAFWPLPSIVLVTTSFLVAARNFQSAWLMRSLGEHIYRDWHSARVQETSASLYVFCLLGQTLLTASVGATIIWFCRDDPAPSSLVPMGIGMGIVAYAVAVAFFTLLAVYRMRRAAKYFSRES